jgi:hypothetical protein
MASQSKLIKDDINISNYLTFPTVLSQPFNLDNIPLDKDSGLTFNFDFDEDIFDPILLNSINEENYRS